MWSGDDAAVVGSPGAQILFTTDILVEHIDFDPTYATGADVGWKAVAVNVSDIAAMGGRPTHAVATLSLPATTPVAFIDELLDGMVAASELWGVSLVGGDVSGADRVSLGVALIGSAPRPVLRSGARPGDAICVTGSLGGAAGGLAALQQGLDGLGELKRRQLRPVARIEEGVAAAAGGASAMIDVSDGFARDLEHIVAASGVGCAVELESIPIDPAAGEVADLILPMEAALTGGEDLELIFTAAEEDLESIRQSWPEGAAPLTRVGTITTGQALIGEMTLDRWKERGWEHLRTR